MTTPEKPSSIRLWLARYKPDLVRCTLRDGSLRELPKPTQARGQWAQLERAIVQLAPTYLEAMRGKECAAARALEVEEDDSASASRPDEQASPLAALVQTLPVIVGLIVDAGDASAARHQQAYELAFQKQLELVKILSDRLSGIERAWHKMILDRAKETGGDVENDSAAMDLLGKFMGGNGSAKKEPDQ
jgi:hypothetical protein